MAVPVGCWLLAQRQPQQIAAPVPRVFWGGAAVCRLRFLFLFWRLARPHAGPPPPQTPYPMPPFPPARMARPGPARGAAPPPPPPLPPHTACGGACDPLRPHAPPCTASRE
jgi:hypothetical protein